MSITAVADPEEPRQPRQNSVVTIADIMEAIEMTQSLNPEWFKVGQGWGPVIPEEDSNAINSNH
jgi:hypothetical protein